MPDAQADRLNRICWAMMMAANARATRVALIALAAVGLSRAFSPVFPLPLVPTPRTSSVHTRIPTPTSSAAVLTQTRSSLVPRRRHRHLGEKQPSHAGLFLFGFGGGGNSSASSRSGAPASSKARRAVESNVVFKSRTEQVRELKHVCVAAHGSTAAAVRAVRVRRIVCYLSSSRTAT